MEFNRRRPSDRGFYTLVCSLLLEVLPFPLFWRSLAETYTDFRFSLPSVNQEVQLPDPLSGVNLTVCGVDLPDSGRDVHRETSSTNPVGKIYGNGMGESVTGLKVDGRGRKETESRERPETSDETTNVSEFQGPLLTENSCRERGTDSPRPHIYGVERMGNSTTNEGEGLFDEQSLRRGPSLGLTL